MNYQPPSPQYAGPPAHYTGGHNKPIKRIVIHSTVSPCKPGGALEIAAYFRTEAAGGSAHYVVDPEKVVQAAWDNTICWHAPPNQHSLGIEMCDIPGPLPGDKKGTARYRAAKRAWRWIKPEQRQMLHRTARLTAELAVAYRVPVAFLTPHDLRKGLHGITTHNNVSLAFGESTHWDPGFWPQKHFMELVHTEAKKIREKNRG